ncbi:probable Zn-dependent hydrolases of the beta-lactamase fold, putative [Armillaria ostoyae]|uniref:Probable Zn-dependent hydrolases of the beta-lactamase fold, putative n=1 Tax=Armillaria ostoyae TaxID=47428 RepID=A0A284QY98_ARMOS|nr:probable Zn-dependent hydrolases of the beta-lactamase fold, putative [Armillaria ostoyae]
MSPVDFKCNLSIKHISTASAIFEIDGVNLLTDPFFSPAGTEWDAGVTVLKNSDTPALGLQDLPPIDAVLLSHEDHPDNLDELGRRLLDGRKVITTTDGARKLHPRPGVRGIRPWETVPLEAGGKRFQMTGTPCQHLPGGKCTGFIITAPEFGSTDGLPNVIYFSGDTVYFEELVEMRDKFHVVVAVLNLGAAKVPLPGGQLQITMDGKQAARLFREIRADILVPMHYESWGHFTQNGEELAKAFEEEGIQDKVCWLTPGVSKKVL